jgi:hypothetical protein
MPNNFFFSLDDKASSRSSAGVLLVVSHQYGSNIIFYCDEHDQFWKKMIGRTLADVVSLKKRDFRPATLLEISEQGALALVDGITGRDAQDRPITLRITNS